MLIHEDDVLLLHQGYCRKTGEYISRFLTAMEMMSFLRVACIAGEQLATILLNNSCDAKIYVLFRSRVISMDYLLPATVSVSCLQRPCYA